MTLAFLLPKRITKISIIDPIGVEVHSEVTLLEECGDIIIDINHTLKISSVVHLNLIICIREVFHARDLCQTGAEG